MGSSKMILRVCKGAFQKAVGIPRVYIAFLWVVFLFLNFVRGIRAFCEMMNYSVSPWLFPHITADTVTQTVIIIGALLLFCDAPFLHSNSGWQILRAGRKNWFWGNMLYIWLLSLLYAVVLSILPILMTLPYVEWSEGWGKILGSLAQTNAAAQFGMSPLNYSIMAQYDPAAAMLLTILPVWLNTVLIGMINYVCNLFTKRGLGAVISVAIALSPLLITRLANFAVGYYLAPPLWMNLSNCKWLDYGYGPSLFYVYMVFLITIGACVVASFLGIRHKDLNTVEEL